MSEQLEHRQIHGALTALAEAKILNLDAPIRTLVDPIASSLAKTGAGGEVSLHILCCNEYALVTGLTSQHAIGEVRQIADSIRASLGQSLARQA